MSHFSRRAVSILSVLCLCMVAAGCAEDPQPTEPTAAPTANETPTPETPTPETPTPAPTPTPTPAPPAFAIRGTVPSDGAMAVPRFPAVEVTLSEVLPAGSESAVSGRLLQGDVEIPLFIDTDRDQPGDKQVSLLPTVPLETDTEYQLEITVSELDGWVPSGGAWPLIWQSSFSTEVPCGVAFDIARDIQIESLGGNDDLVAVLQGVLDRTGLAPISLLFVDTFTSAVFPLEDVQLVAGLPVRADDGEGYAPDPAFGFPVSIDACDIAADGWVTCSETTFVFPIPITDTTVIYLAISQANLEGRATGSGAFEEFDDFSLQGVITEEDLIVALEAAGLANVADYIILDVDTDGDGKMDAASASATSDPVWMDFADCDETGAL